MRVTTKDSELGECYAENIVEIAERNYNLIDEIQGFLSGCDCFLCHSLQSDALHMASLHLWFEKGGRLAFIDPPERKGVK